MKVDNDILGDGRRTRTRKESKQQSNRCSRKEKKKGRRERREPSFKKNCLPNSALKRTRSKRIPQVLPKEQEAKLSSPPLRTIHS
jgi:hypothetical protein